MDAKAVVIDGGELKYLAAARWPVQLSGAGITPATTNGCDDPSVKETSTNAVCICRAGFPDDADSYGWWTMVTPSNWNGTIRVEKIVWSADAGSAGDTVEWELAAVGGGDDDAIDAALGTAVSISDAVTAAGDRQVCGSGSSLTPAGSPSAGDELHFRLARDVSAGTLAQTAYLHEILITLGLSGASA